MSFTYSSQWTYLAHLASHLSTYLPIHPVPLHSLRTIPQLHMYYSARPAPSFQLFMQTPHPAQTRPRNHHHPPTSRKPASPILRRQTAGPSVPQFPKRQEIAGTRHGQCHNGHVADTPKLTARRARARRIRRTLSTGRGKFPGTGHDDSAYAGYAASGKWPSDSTVPFHGRRPTAGGEGWVPYKSTVGMV